MANKVRYVYTKRAQVSSGPAQALFRHPVGRSLHLQEWQDGEWVSAHDQWWAFVQETDYFEIGEPEVIAEMAELVIRQREMAAKRHAEIEFANARRVATAETTNEQGRQHGQVNSDPGWSRLETAAIALNELYRSLQAGGFSDEEALTLISKVMLSKDEEATTGEEAE